MCFIADMIVGEMSWKSLEGIVYREQAALEQGEVKMLTIMTFKQPRKRSLAEDAGSYKIRYH